MHSHRMEAAPFTEGHWSDAERCSMPAEEILLIAAWLDCPNQAYKKLTGFKSRQHMLALIFCSPCLGARPSCMQWQAAGEQTGRDLQRDLQPELPLARLTAPRWLLGEAYTHDCCTIVQT